MISRLFAVLILAAPLTAFAQRDDDAPIPYDDDQPKVERTKKHRRDDEGERLREEDEDEEKREKAEKLTHLDDPNVGLSVEFAAGAMLLESSRGARVDPRFGWGFRFTWEFGRLIADEYLREMFFADLTWLYAATHDGTTQVNADSNSHDFTIAPAFALPFGKSFMSAYAQVGAGFNYDWSAVHVGMTETNLAGTKFLFQYGLGLRGRPAVSESGAVRISFRIEVTRLMRGYLTDTFLGGSLGVTF